MYTVVGSIRSRTRRVIWMLEELGAPYKRQIAPPRSEAARAVNPTGKIPALITGADTLTDSVAILQFLADRHGQFTFETGTIARAHQDSLTQRVVDEFDSVLWTAGKHAHYLPEAERIPDVAASCQKELARNMSALAPLLEGNAFLMGAQMTVPDFVLLHCLEWARGADFEITEPVLANWAKLLRKRPGYRATLALKE